MGQTHGYWILDTVRMPFCCVRQQLFAVPKTGAESFMRFYRRHQGQDMNKNGKWWVRNIDIEMRHGENVAHKFMKIVFLGIIHFSADSLPCFNIHIFIWIIHGLYLFEKVYWSSIHEVWDRIMHIVYNKFVNVTQKVMKGWDLKLTLFLILSFVYFAFICRYQWVLYIL